MAAALLGGVPGVSQVFCGSAVTYREATKTCWLDVPEATLQRYTAESPEATRALADQVLRHTPEATVAAAVTGHLGPDADDDIDGLVHMGVMLRPPADNRAGAPPPTSPSSSPYQATTIRLEQSGRRERQMESATRLLQFISDTLASWGEPAS